MDVLLDRLNSWKATAHSQLAALWSTAALPVAERDELLAALGNELRRVLERSVATEKARQAALTAELPALHAELAVLRSRLADQSTLVGIGADDSVSDARPLIPRHRALTAYVMAGRGTVASRLAERQEKEARISAIRLELDGPESVSALEGLGDEPFVGSAGGLALSLLGQLTLGGLRTRRSWPGGVRSRPGHAGD